MLAVVWHFWIGVVLMFSAILVLALTVAGYFAKVTRLKYPPRR